MEINKVGQKVTEYRQRLGLSREQFAELMDVSIFTVQRWEWGKTRPSKELLNKLFE